MCNSKRLCENEECKICFENSFASHEKSKYWSAKNGDVKPRQVFKKTSSKKCWFLCYCGHEFNILLSNLATHNQWCPYCANKQLCGKEDCKTCFDKSFASHEKSKYWSGDNELKPVQVFKFSDKKITFDCNCGHQFESVLKSITKNTWCPYCCFPTMKICKKEECQNCFQKSFASHEKSKYWSEKNRDQPDGYEGLFISPIHVIKCSAQAYWFNCECGHEYYTPLSYLCKTVGGCLYCCNPPKKMCDNKCCQSCIKKSFASHDKSKYWSDKNGDVKPRQVFKGTPNKYWFDCICGHSFESPLCNITTSNQWCPYCSNPPHKLCEKDCKSCFQKSFASHEKSKYWSDKNVDDIGNKIQPNNVFTCSGKKYWFICEKKHLFDCTLNNINNGFWCPICVNKTEKKLYEQLLRIYPNLVSQFRADWCKNIISKRNFPFDFVLEEHKIIIELDGNQHFVQIWNWKTPEEQFKNDQYKEKCANENGYSVIRIIQEDVWNDAYDWLNELNKNIIKITSENTMQNIYMCKNNEYSKFNHY